MSRSRTFTFIVNKPDTSDWEKICNFEKNGLCKYISLYKTPKEIKGFIRFENPRACSAVSKLFESETTVQAVSNSDLYYKDIFSKRKFYFESGKQAAKSQNKKSDREISDLLEEKDQIIEKQNTIINQHNEQLLEEKDKIISLYKDQLNELIETFKECKENDSEQIKQITNICKTIAKNTPINTYSNNTNSHNTVNNKFNLKIFLNEQCKDALNLVDFAKSIQIKLEDVLLYKKLGHAEAVSEIFDKAYKNLDLNRRPMHCTDIKRETLYVRNDDKWVNDETKELSEKAIEIISNNSFRELKQWKEANPDYMTDETKKHEYMLIMKHLMGGTTDKELDENAKKIIRNLSKNTHLDKGTTYSAHPLGSLKVSTADDSRMPAASFTPYDPSS
jgi:hypothetical protein